MSISLKHTFQSAKADGSDSTLVQPSNWNAEHTLTLATNKLVGRSTAGTGAAEEISLSADLTLSAGVLGLAVPGGSVTPVTLFAGIGSVVVPAAAHVVVSSGYTSDGIGPGTYVADSVANSSLAAAHPRFCKADAAGRYFRLVGTEVNVAQGGATGTGNDQPAIQAAVNYANAVGIPAARLLPVHESWQPTFPGGSPNATLGHHLVITGDVALLGAEQGTTITLKGQGGVARTKTDGTASWMSGWLFYSGNAVTKSILRNITVEGTLTFSNVKSNAESNVQDKGVIMANWGAPNIVTVDHRNVTLRNFAGEIWYMGGTFDTATVYVENLTLTGSPQACWNPGSLAQVEAVNLHAGDSYQPVEAISGKGHVYRGGRIFNGYSNSFITTESFDATYHYDYPLLTETYPRWTRFEGTLFDKAGQVVMGPRTSGRIVTVDCGPQFANYGKICDVNLEVEAWCDTANNNPMMIFSGIANTTTQVPSCPAGVYYQTPRNFRIKAVMKRTERAQAAGYKWASAVRFAGGLIDRASCVFEITGDAVNAVADFSSPASGSQMPLVLWDDSVGIKNGVSASPSADFSVDTGITHNGINPQAGGTFTMTLTNANALAFVEGQRLRVIYGLGGSGRNIRMPATGNGYTLRETRVLRQLGDYVDLGWDQGNGAWLEVACKVRPLTGSATYDPPSIASGAQATTTVTVSGAAVGDRVELTFSNSLGGLVLTGYVSASGTVTAVFANLTGGAVDLASGTLTAVVRPS